MTSGASLVQPAVGARPASNADRVAQSTGQVSFRNLQGQGFSNLSGSPFQSLTTLTWGGNLFPSV